ncbi:MAG: hypothetical protein ABSG86_29540 [Thermoguttaceae bacterium]|jgi:hypothetical protein
MRYLVALTRGGSPSVDLMAWTLDGNKSVAIQVKTAERAFKPATKKNPGYWEWIIGSKKPLRGESIFYAFVDLKVGTGEPPEVFIVPADVVATHLIGFPRKEPEKFWFVGEEEDKEKWRERWDLIEEALGTSTGGGSEHPIPNP